MKHIQWFPGHMTKAMRMMEENVPLVDGVLCILDARAPAATFNKNLKKLTKTHSPYPALYNTIRNIFPKHGNHFLRVIQGLLSKQLNKHYSSQTTEQAIQTRKYATVRTVFLLWNGSSRINQLPCLIIQRLTLFILHFFPQITNQVL